MQYPIFRQRHLAVKNIIYVIPCISMYIMFDQALEPYPARTGKSKSAKRKCFSSSVCHWLHIISWSYHPASTLRDSVFFKWQFHSRNIFPDFPTCSHYNVEVFHGFSIFFASVLAFCQAVPGTARRVDDRRRLADIWNRNGIVLQKPYKSIIFLWRTIPYLLILF